MEFQLATILSLADDIYDGTKIVKIYQIRRELQKWLIIKCAR